MSNKLLIPEFYKEKLKDNSLLNGLVETTIGNFEVWLGQNKMKFFDGFTDHSIEHINEVMKLSVDLIREECCEYLTERDAAVLIIACLLHDCAMHLSKDGFIDLVTGGYKNKSIKGFKDKAWKELWDDFIAETRRFSSRKLISIFGDAEPVNPPDLSKANFTDKEYLLIGEFIRRYHHRLAHEIALFGVPGPLTNKVKIDAKGDYDYIPDLAGLIARSHGMDIRSCFNYLIDNYSSYKEQRKTHSVFLMALLRISDILQIQPERAPKEMDKIRTLVSPFSVLEWEVHQAVKDIKFGEYPETVFIESKPEKNKIYLKTKELLSNIQYELDKSWTTIGEVYAFESKWKEFGLNIRRVRSNLDDVENFSKSVEYIPVKAAFEAADSDLLKLLIEPLYGNIPGVGVRELLQNSVDAVRELREYLKNNKMKNLDQPDIEGDVVISVYKDEYNNDWFMIEDKGIGMSLDVIKNYFLKSGATFRKSDLWKRNFEDEKGKSKILRSGRFGIGVLSAYLLGDEIIVSTRYIRDNSGIEFTTKLEEEFIEFKKINRPLGTTIKVKLIKSALLELENEETWDWYTLNDIKIVRKKYDKHLGQKYNLPEIKSKLPKGWYRIKHSSFSDIQWNYNLYNNTPGFVCNGLIIKQSEMQELAISIKGSVDYLNLQAPSLSVFDPDSNLPLDLTRTKLSSDYIPFQKELMHDILLDFISFILVYVPKKNIPLQLSKLYYRGYGPFGYPVIDIFLFTNNGYTLSLDVGFYNNAKIKSLITLFTYHHYIHPMLIKLANKLNTSNGIRLYSVEGHDDFGSLWLLPKLESLLSNYNFFKSHRILINNSS